MGHHGSNHFRRARVAILGLISILPMAWGQKTEVACAKIDWAFNSLGQSPCLTAAFLGQPCFSRNGSFDVAVLKPNQTYTAGSSTSCECNSVFYSLLSACAFCQGGDISTWTKYASNCSSVGHDGLYPHSIPNKTSVPMWAFQLVFASNQFNVTLAQSGKVGGTIQSTSVTSASMTATSSPTAPTPAASQSSEASPPRKSHSDTIVGGVVGGLSAVVTVCGIVFFMLRKRREKWRASQLEHKRPGSFYLRSSTVRDMRTYNVSPTYVASSKDLGHFGTTKGSVDSDHSAFVVSNPNAVSEYPRQADNRAVGTRELPISLQYAKYTS